MLQFSLGLSVPRFGFGSAGGIKIPSVKIHDVETAKEKKARTLKHLLKLNHVNHAVLHNQLRFHNHMPHVQRPEVPQGSCPDTDVKS